MKKIFIIAGALVFTSGILASKTKVSTAKTTTITFQIPVSANRKDLASAD